MLQLVWSFHKSLTPTTNLLTRIQHWFTHSLLTVFEPGINFIEKLCNIKDSSLVQKNPVHCGMWIDLLEQKLNTQEYNTLMSNSDLVKAPLRNGVWCHSHAPRLRSFYTLVSLGNLKVNCFGNLFFLPPNVPTRARRGEVLPQNSSCQLTAWLPLSCPSLICPIVLPKLSHREAAEARFPSVIAKVPLHIVRLAASSTEDTCSSQTRSQARSLTIGQLLSQPRTKTSKNHVRPRKCYLLCRAIL